MSATSNWAAAREVTVTLTSAQPCTDGSIELAVGDWDATNLLGGTSANGQLFEEEGTDTVGVTLNFTVVVDKSALKTYSIGALVTGVSYAGPDGLTHAGSFRIKRVTKPISAKGGFKISLSGKFTGVVSNV